MKINITKEQKKSALAEERNQIKKWANPKSKIRKVSKIEEDGSKTIAHVVEWDGIGKFHSMEGPALINKEQKIKEYYLNGIEYTYDDWNEIQKGREGLPWYKNPAMKGTSRH